MPEQPNNLVWQIGWDRNSEEVVDIGRSDQKLVEDIAGWDQESVEDIAGWDPTFVEGIARWGQNQVEELRLDRSFVQGTRWDRNLLVAKYSDRK